MLQRLLQHISRIPLWSLLFFVYGLRTTLRVWSGVTPRHVCTPLTGFTDLSWVITAMRKKELWFALLLIIPTLIVGGLYTHTTRSCAVTITVHDPDQCGGQVSPSTPQRIRPGENVVIAITLGHCQSWEGQIRNTAQTLLYRATDVQARNIRIDR